MGQTWSSVRGNRVVRVVVYAFVAWKLVQKFRLVQSYLEEVRHKRKFLEMLPQMENPKNGKWSPIGSLAVLPPGVPFTQETYGKHFISGLVNVLKTQQHLRDEGVICFWLLNKNIPGHALAAVFVRDIKLVRELLSAKMLPNLKKGRSYKISEPLIGHGVLSTHGEEWAKQRPIIEQGFKAKVLREQFPLIVKTVDELCDKLNGSGRNIDVQEEMLKTTLDVLGRVAFSYEIGSVTAETTDDAPLYNAFDYIIKSLIARIRDPMLQLTRDLPLERNRKFNALMKKLDDTVEDIVNKRVRAMEKREERQGPKDLLDIILSGETVLSRSQIVDNIKTMLFAGHDTTANLLTWALYLLAKHPESIGQIREEFQSKLGGEISFDSVEKAEYLNAVVLEVLRLYPSAAFTRSPLVDIQLGKYTIPKGSEIILIPYITQRSPDSYDQPDEFIPTRWIKERKESLSLQATLALETINNALLPFSLGYRNCVGRPLALLEVRVALLKIVSQFELELPKVPHPDFQEVPSLTLTLNPCGIRLDFIPRMS